MTQDQLNTACSFPHGTINKIENGKYCPTAVHMNAIKRVLGIVMKYAKLHDAQFLVQNKKMNMIILQCSSNNKCIAHESKLWTNFLKLL